MTDTCQMSSCITEATQDGLCAYHWEMANKEPPADTELRVLVRILEVLTEIRDALEAGK